MKFLDNSATSNAPKLEMQRLSAPYKIIGNNELVPRRDFIDRC